ncbi:MULTISPECIES: TlpA family protein disulfide reductase [unclassified Nitrospina]|uniref:TlpA family protein disulfide reductase n=1 Tax=unclassified Nitrospina TaxID=2638683 RepID=UPI003F9461E1
MRHFNLKNKVHLLFALAASLLLLTGAGTESLPPKEKLFDQFGVTPPRTAKEAPDFTLTTLEGKQVSLKEYEGKPILIHFWATWCVPCKEELPTIQKLHENLGGEVVQILTINIDRWNKDRVEEFQKDFGLRFPILLDPKQEVRRKYFIMGLPTSYLVGADGKLAGYISGPREWNSPVSHQIMKTLAHHSG